VLKKEFRLKSREDFLRIKKDGKTKWGNYFGISSLPKDTFKIGFVVTKKVFANAVDRNRFRRVFSSALQKIELPETGWFVVIAKKESKNLKVLDCIDEIANLGSFKNI